MTFEEVRDSVVLFLRDSRSGDPIDLLSSYFGGLSETERIMPAEELLDLLAEGTRRPFTYEDTIRSGSPGVITMRLHYAYPHLLTVLGWWVWATHSTHMKTTGGLTSEAKALLHEYLTVGIEQWDWDRRDHARYASVLRSLLPPPPPKPQEEKSPPGFLCRIARVVLSFGKQ